MKASKWMMLLACAVIGTGLCADDQKPERPAKRPGGNRMGMRMDMSQILGLNEAEQKSLADAETALKEAVQKIREKALEDTKKVVGESFDAKLKAYKEAVARMTDEKAKARSEKMIARMEENRDRIVERLAARMLAPERGRRPGFGGPEGGPRPMPPRREKAPADAAK